MMKNRKKLAGVLATATVLTSAFAPLTVMAEDFDAYNPPVAEVEAGQIKGFMEMIPIHSLVFRMLHQNVSRCLRK